jgi:hypothetical protein
VIFTDIIHSTDLLIAHGDWQWKEIQNRHDALVDRALERYRGHKVKPIGHGVLATFNGPARAVQCGCASGRWSRCTTDGSLGEGARGRLGRPAVFRCSRTTSCPRTASSPAQIRMSATASPRWPSTQGDGDWNHGGSGRLRGRWGGVGLTGICAGWAISASCEALVLLPGVLRVHRRVPAPALQGEASTAERRWASGG